MELHHHDTTFSSAVMSKQVRRDDVFVVLPTYNEAENLRNIAARIAEQGPQLLIVDDNSPDGTGDIADELASSPRVHVLHRSSKQGLGPAYAAGFNWAMEHGAEMVCEMDADFSHDPSDLPRLFHAVDTGADVAIGSRYVTGGGVENWPWHRRLLSRGGNVYAAMMLGAGIKDMTSGFRAYSTNAIHHLQPDTCRASGYGFQIEMAWRAQSSGLRIVEIPIVFRDRELGTSKMDGPIAFEAIRLVTGWGFSRLGGRLRWPAEEE
jgi:dolichol-phosphate mannosyltransferase